MSSMSDLEAVFCRTRLWRGFARRVVIPAVLEPELAREVLEIGCGAGGMAVEVLRRHPEVERFVATDVDPAMVRKAGTALAAFADRADVRVADAAALPFADESFDLVCSWLMLHHTIEWEAVVREAHRVLRPGGRLVGYDLPDSPGTRAIHRISRSHVRMVSRRELRDGLHTCGFSSVRVERLGGVLRHSGSYRFEAVR